MFTRSPDHPPSPATLVYGAVVYTLSGIRAQKAPETCVFILDIGKALAIDGNLLI